MRQMVMFPPYQSYGYHLDAFYAVRADALPAFSSILQEIPLFSVLHVVLELNAFQATLNQTSLWVIDVLVSTIHLNRRWQYHQNNLSWLGQICQKIVHL